LEKFASVDFCVTRNNSDIEVGDFEPPLKLHHLYSKIGPTTDFVRPENDDVV